MADAASHDSTAPPKPARLTVEFYRDADSIVVHRRRGRGIVWFLVIWLSFWTLGCVLLAGKVIQEPTWQMLLFALPFWASWWAVFLIIWWQLTGKETLVVGRDSALFARSAKVRLTSREVPRDELRFFREYRTSYEVNDEHLLGIELVTLGRPVRCFEGLAASEIAWLVHQLNDFLGLSPADLERLNGDPLAALQGCATDKAATNGGAADGSPAKTTSDSSSRRAKLSLADVRPQPPSNCRWRFIDDGDALVFARRGNLPVSATAGLLFINLFWNSIVGIFVSELVRAFRGAGPLPGDWWGKFAFLVPFELVGLTMLALLAGALLVPFRTTQWRLGRHELSETTRSPLGARQQTWSPQRLAGVYLDHCDADDAKTLSAVFPFLRDEQPFRLTLLENDGSDLCAWPDLTKGEALWIAHYLLHDRAEWFAR